MTEGWRRVAKAEKHWYLRSAETTVGTEEFNVNRVKPAGSPCNHDGSKFSGNLIVSAIEDQFVTANPADGTGARGGGRQGASFGEQHRSNASPGYRV